MRRRWSGPDDDDDDDHDDDRTAADATAVQRGGGPTLEQKVQERILQSSRGQAGSSIRTAADATADTAAHNLRAAGAGANLSEKWCPAG